MKRIYLLMILMVAATANSFAAPRSVDLRILHYFSQSPATTVALMKDGDKIFSSAGGEFSYNFAWKIINGSTTDSILSVDTLNIHAAYQGNSYFLIPVSSLTGNKYMKPGDTLTLSPSTGKVTLTPTSSVTASGTSTVPWCDTVWIKPCASCGNTVSDPAAANNKTCNNISLTSWVTSVGTLQAAVQGMVLYPNPTTNKLNLAYDFGSNNSGVVVIRDVMGKTVYTKDLGKNISGAQQIALEIGALNSGTYFLQLQTSNATESTKFIIQ